jgi:hypothetical protein
MEKGSKTTKSPIGIEILADRGRTELLTAENGAYNHPPISIFNTAAEAPTRDLSRPE